MSHRLSKSRYMAGLQCPKILWLGINKPDIAAAPDRATQRVFDIGHRVGEYAQELFPGGVLIAEDHTQLSQAISKTTAAVSGGVSAVFEATVAFNKILCRADILKRVEKTGNLWDIYEVKSSTSVKEQHYPDLAIQKYCFEGQGYNIRNTLLMHVNNSYFRKGDIEPDKLLVAKDVSNNVAAALENVPVKTNEFFAVMDSPVCPAITPGRQCEEPYTCIYFDFCNEAPPDYSIYELSHGRKVISELEALGVILLKDIPDGFCLSEKHSNQVASVKTKKPVFDKAAVKGHLDKLKYPLYFFDFETVSCALPLFNNSRPYQNVPFQFSLHIQDKPDGPCRHVEFLLQDREDPREKLIRAMLDSLGSKGTIVAYYKPFEESCIKGLAHDFSQYKDRLLALLPRFWDLIVPFQKGYYTHYDFHGSASLKSVLPALVPSLSYQELAIQEGGEASLTAELWYAGKMDQEEWEQRYSELLQYCALDTLAMVEVLKILYAAV